MKRLLAVLLALSLSAAFAAAALADAETGTSLMYVTTPNGKPVNVRSEPVKDNNVICSVHYGDQVLTDWSYAGNDGWTRVILDDDRTGYIMSRYLSDTDPGPAPTPTPEEQEEEAEQKLYAEEKTEQEVDPFYIILVPARASGWVNFRSGPAKTAQRISTFEEGKELIVEAETGSWYRARDPRTDLVGYIYKQDAQKLNKQVIRQKELPEGVLKLGSLNINGEFDLTCKLPDGYDLQVVKARGDRIVAAVLPTDTSKPQLCLSVAFDDAYSDVERLNDMTADELTVLENTYRETNDVDISYRETSHGTKLLVARETGDDDDFVDILAVYKGYFVEFNMTPNSRTSDKTLTDEQFEMCISFLSDVDFTPVQQ